MEPHTQGSKYCTDQANQLVKKVDIHQELKHQGGTRILTPSRNVAVPANCPPPPAPGLSPLPFESGLPALPPSLPHTTESLQDTCVDSSARMSVLRPPLRHRCSPSPFGYMCP